MYSIGLKLLFWLLLIVHVENFGGWLRFQLSKNWWIFFSPYVVRWNVQSEIILEDDCLHLHMRKLDKSVNSFSFHGTAVLDHSLRLMETYFTACIIVCFGSQDLWIDSAGNCSENCFNLMSFVRFLAGLKFSGISWWICEEFTAAPFGFLCAWFGWKIMGMQSIGLGLNDTMHVCLLDERMLSIWLSLFAFSIVLKNESCS